MAVMLIAPISTQNIQREWKNRVQEVSWTVQSARAYVDTIVCWKIFPIEWPLRPDREVEPFSYHNSLGTWLVPASSQALRQISRMQSLLERI